MQHETFHITLLCDRYNTKNLNVMSPEAISIQH